MTSFILNSETAANDGWQAREAAVSNILVKLLPRDTMPDPNVSFGIRGLSRLLSRQYEIDRTRTTSRSRKKKGTGEPPTRKGRATNASAMRVARLFAISYEMITRRTPGVNVDSDFVMTLGDLFDALSFSARPQHYAKQAVEALSTERRQMENELLEGLRGMHTIP